MQLQKFFDPIVNRVIGHNSRATNAHFSFYIKTSVKSVQVGTKSSMKSHYYNFYSDWSIGKLYQIIHFGL